MAYDDQSGGYGLRDTLPPQGDLGVPAFAAGRNFFLRRRCGLIGRRFSFRGAVFCFRVRRFVGFLESFLE